MEDANFLIGTARGGGVTYIFEKRRVVIVVEDNDGYWDAYDVIASGCVRLVLQRHEEPERIVDLKQFNYISNVNSFKSKPFETRSFRI